MTPEELVEDAESIGGLEPSASREQVKRSLAYTLTFPPQEHKLGEGQDVDRPGDAASRRARSSSSTARRGSSC